MSSNQRLLAIQTLVAPTPNAKRKMEPSIAYALLVT
jgi:hypothetical protein